jgi:uncharacterized protein with HEPN domain
MIALRNVLAHNYEEIQNNRIWEVITKDIPLLITYFDSLLADNPPPGEP